MCGARGGAGQRVCGAEQRRRQRACGVARAAGGVRADADGRVPADAAQLHAGCGGGVRRRVQRQRAVAELVPVRKRAVPAAAGPCAGPRGCDRGEQHDGAVQCGHAAAGRVSDSVGARRGDRVHHAADSDGAVAAAECADAVVRTRADGDRRGGDDDGACAS